MNSNSVRDYCNFRLATDSPEFAELDEEYHRDPIGSRVGRYCRETENIVMRVADAELNWAQMLIAWDAADSETNSVNEYESVLAGPTDLLKSSGDAQSESKLAIVGDFGVQRERRGSRVEQASSAAINRTSRAVLGTKRFVIAFGVLCTLGISTWFAWSKSLQNDQLEFALATLVGSQQPTGSREIRKALSYVETTLGRGHSAYKEGQSRLHFSLSNKEQNYDAAAAVAMEVAEDAESNIKADWLLRAARDSRLAGHEEKSKELLIEAANASNSIFSTWAWDSLSKLEHSAGNLSDAIRFGTNAVESTDDDISKAQTLEALAELYFEAEEWAKARETMTRAIDLNNRNSIPVGPSSYEIVALAAQRMNEPEAELAARKQLVASIDNGGFPRDKRYAVSVRQLAEAEFRTGSLVAADEACVRAIQEFRRIGDSDSADFAETLVLESRLENGTGQHASAQTMATNAIEILNRKDKDSRNRWYLSTAFGELSESQRSLGDLVSSEKSAQAGLDLARQTGDAKLIAARWLNLSGVSVAAGRFDEARLRIAEAETSSAEYSVLTRQSLLASALVGSGKPREAAEILELTLQSAMHPDNRVVMEFQLAGVLSKIPERENEAAGLLAKSERAIEERFQEREITPADIATAFNTVEPLSVDQEPNPLLFPSSSTSGNPYFG